MSLLEFNNNGIYCPVADVYIDPWKPVRKALITHGHSDHARFGHQKYIASEDAVPVIRYRLKVNNIFGVPYGQNISINGVRFSFHPAGHIVGSAQIRVEHKGEIWVVSGDYKVQDDGISGAFEPVRCHTFITECTFGLPVYTWSDQHDVYRRINEWWAKNRSSGKTSIIIAYSLGKAQRVIRHLDTNIGRIFTHGAVENINEVLRHQGIDLPQTTRVTNGSEKGGFTGNIVVAPGSAMGSPWMRRFQPYSVAMVSGWMMVRGIRRRRNVEKGFVMSDHADWKGLIEAIEYTGASRVITTHGYTDIFARHLRGKGLEAITEKTSFEGELIDDNATDP